MPELHDLLERRAQSHEPPPDLLNRVLDRSRRRELRRRVGAGLIAAAILAGVGLGAWGALRSSPPRPATPQPVSPPRITWQRVADDARPSRVDGTIGGEFVHVGASTDELSRASLWRSSDGLTWSKSPMPDQFTKSGLRGLARNGVLWVVTGSAPDLWRTSDGTKWTPVQLEGVGARDIGLIVDPHVGPVTIGDTVVVPASFGDALWVSRDGGFTFQGVFDPFGFEQMAGRLPDAQFLWERRRAWLLASEDEFAVLINWEKEHRVELWTSSNGLEWRLINSDAITPFPECLAGAVVGAGGTIVVVGCDNTQTQVSIGVWVGSTLDRFERMDTGLPWGGVEWLVSTDIGFFFQPVMGSATWSGDGRNWQTFPLEGLPPDRQGNSSLEVNGALVLTWSEAERLMFVGTVQDAARP